MRLFISMKAAARDALARPARAEVRHLAALAETFGGIGEALDRADLVMQEQDGDGEQYERGTHHPAEEDVRVGGIGGVAARDTRSTVVEPHADPTSAERPTVSIQNGLVMRRRSSSQSV